ncbi:hypothetical protein NDN08_001715 [Rhodosorus marinus]|uniref:JmjC domain-containing protein n=1 Tax=Rhodosorus marinus TaxID=101924 RepID=A0AAV8UUM5_9RHOD|nr:hypothetical protein NDN08_001715 [Rhodosorus marinus]
MSGESERLYIRIVPSGDIDAILERVGRVGTVSEVHRIDRYSAAFLELRADAKEVDRLIRALDGAKFRGGLLRVEKARNEHFEKRLEREREESHELVALRLKANQALATGNLEDGLGHLRSRKSSFSDNESPSEVLWSEPSTPDAIVQPPSKPTFSDSEQENQVLERGSHPLGVRPLGDALARNKLNEAERTRVQGLGRLAVLEDGQILQILGLLDPDSLARCSQLSRFFYALASEEDLWRKHVLSREETSKLRIVGGSWKATYREMTLEKLKVGVELDTRLWLRLNDVYSDVLFHSWHCASAGISPKWLSGDNVERFPIDDFSEDHFTTLFDESNRPFILKDWKTRTGGSWSREWLISKCDPSKRVNAGGFLFSLPEYFDYMDSVVDDQPLYLFDKQFAENLPEVAEAYSSPECYGKDFFSLLPESFHPDWRWLIIGGRRSGSSFHKDPNETSAWNGVVRGSKRWLMLPPGAGPPPGIQPSADGGSVVGPMSAMEWFLNFFDMIVDHPQLVQCTTIAGEVLYVPRGWWHIVLNLEETVAITQNFVTRNALPHVLRLLREHPDHLSGVQISAERLDAELCESIREAYPEVLEAAEAKLSRTSLWGRLKRNLDEDSTTESACTKRHNASEPSSGFSFGFGS